MKDSETKEPVFGHEPLTHKTFTPPETSSWEEAFDKEFYDSNLAMVTLHDTDPEDVKDFIRSIATSEYKRGVEAERKRINVEDLLVITDEK